jgi:hypothetical protein
MQQKIFTHKAAFFVTSLLKSEQNHVFSISAASAAFFALMLQKPKITPL